MHCVSSSRQHFINSPRLCAVMLAAQKSGPRPGKFISPLISVTNRSVTKPFFHSRYDKKFFMLRRASPGRQKVVSDSIFHFSSNFTEALLNLIPGEIYDTTITQDTRQKHLKLDRPLKNSAQE